MKNNLTYNISKFGSFYKELVRESIFYVCNPKLDFLGLFLILFFGLN